MADPDTGTPFDLAAHIEELSTRADSGYVILTAAITEEWLEKLLLTYMRKPSNRLATKIFSDYGPLSSFAAKVDVAYALGLIERDTYDDLRAIRSIRNAFAHTRDFMHFSSPAIPKPFKRFKQWRPGCDARVLFDEGVTHSVNTIKAKIDRFMYAHALRDEPEPGKSR